MAEAVLGVLGLVGTAIDVLKLGYIASDRKDNVTVLRGCLHLEGVLLRRWAECVLIGPPGEVPIISREDCAIVHERLSTMLALFRNAGNLVHKHSKDMQPLFPPSQAEHDQEVGPSMLRRHTTFSNFISKMSIKSSPFKWAVRDSEVLRELLGDIQAIRVGLAELLPPDMKLISLQVLTDIMPSTSPDSTSSMDSAARITTDNNTADAHALDTLRATLAIRTMSPDAIPTLEEANTRMRELFIKNYSVSTSGGVLPLGKARCSVLMGSQHFSLSPRPVVIEWRQFNPDLYSDFVLFEADVVKLCWLLHSLKSHPDVHLPRCLGYIKDSNYSSTRLGIVLEYPSIVNLPLSMTQTSQESLYDALKNSSYRLPAIEIRLSLAMNITASVFQLLSAGWLHKGLRSDNILLANGLKIVSSREVNQQPAAIDFILGGFEFARLDKPGQVSDGSNNPDERDLYRHPNATSEKRRSQEYKQRGYLKSYDIYSLGVLLCELGFWRTIRDLKATQEKRDDWKSASFSQYLRHRVGGDMPGMMGSRFTRVVLWCLDTDRVETLVSDEDGLVQFEEQVLVNLSQCRRAVTFLS
ncbi:uncharacterized protein FTOL_10155 [Fusarium torulosum]|uniref:Protein kinase domain-containing protein n=1 Tax=Fusarium torulosum TaxID=33205 RepID=A0AAE8MH23_9HYPO|nr:uncharacterized protein FTOL_10155 [Fusarium torulosum]